MAIVKVSGKVMNVITRQVEGRMFKDLLLYQDGETDLLKIKGVENGYQPGDEVEDIVCKATPWQFNNRYGVTYKAIKE